jgi:hypothetical protein
VRQGSLITSYTSADGSNWNVVGSQSLSLGSTVYVGLAVSSHNTAARTTARFSNVTVQVPSTTNRPPTVSLTSPANGATFTAPATIALAATASDPDSNLARVEFMSGTTRLATDTTAPYSSRPGPGWMGPGQHCQTSHRALAVRRGFVRQPPHSTQ